MNIFERTRNNLIQDGLIKDKPTSFCRPIGDLGLDNCHICTTDAMCTEMDTATGKVTHTFFKGSKKHQNVRLTETESIIYVWWMEFWIPKGSLRFAIILVFWDSCLFIKIVVDWRSAVGISPSLWTQICLVSSWWPVQRKIFYVSDLCFQMTGATRLVLRSHTITRKQIPRCCKPKGTV